MMSMNLPGGWKRIFSGLTMLAVCVKILFVVRGEPNIDYVEKWETPTSRNLSGR